jgi:hypothetical protein
MNAVAQLIGQRFQLFNAGTVQSNDCTLSMQSARNFFTNSAGCTGNESLTASQIKHEILLNLICGQIYVARLL